jgi:1-acyl-sn-glycerol-3-phosphate acyltransferase
VVTVADLVSDRFLSPGGAFRTAAALIVLPLLIAILVPLGLALALLGASARTIHPLYVLFARAALTIGRTTLEVRGCRMVSPGGAFVVVSNHESGWDPLCLLLALRELVLRFVVKESIMRTPLLGRGLFATGNVLVVRTDTASDVRRIEAEMQRRDPEVSMVFFAEGTRARDGALHPFKKGAFATALQHGLPVLPVAIAGTYRIWPKGTLRLQAGRVVVVVGEPIPTAGSTAEDRDALRARCFDAVRELRASARARLRGFGSEPGGID